MASLRGRFALPPSDRRHDALDRVTRLDLVDARPALDVIVVSGTTIIGLVVGALTARRRTA
jgi:hypothetical protein